MAGKGSIRERGLHTLSNTLPLSNDLMVVSSQQTVREGDIGGEHIISSKCK
jgi:hypothetical protein